RQINWRRNSSTSYELKEKHSMTSRTPGQLRKAVIATAVLSLLLGVAAVCAAMAAAWQLFAVCLVMLALVGNAGQIFATKFLSLSTSRVWQVLARAGKSRNKSQNKIVAPKSQDATRIAQNVK